ncbi:WD40 repeat domain-containing protein [Candidatus Chloroploca sp. Khr17]|uniref:WD40 repeat domain-containing protein n=1 Tax=Candidatus Chloroploca sp. Khr17 TaxID=2496869 RepID=UPI00101C9761|nr:hypothetical protein [Candidatus Chloroploca sp. Khr17]
MFSSRQRGRAVPTDPLRPTLTQGWQAQLDGYIISLRWASHGQSLAAATVDGPITIFAADGTRLHELPGHTMVTTALDWHPEGRIMASSGQDGHVRLWDAVTDRGPAA